MPRRSRRQQLTGVAKSRAYNPSNVPQYSPTRRFDIPAVERQVYVDEAKHLRRLLSLAEVVVPLEDPPARRLVSSGRRRPAPSPVLAPRRADRVAKRLVLSFPTFNKLREAVICAKRQVRRELVFASGAGGSSRNVKDRASPSKVRC